MKSISKFSGTAFLFLLAVDIIAVLILLPASSLVLLNHHDGHYYYHAAEATIISSTTNNRRRRRGVRRRKLSASRRKLGIRDQRDPPLTGGFFAVANFEEDPVIMEAATFVLQAVIQQQQNGDGDGDSSSPSPPYDFGTSSSSSASIITDFRIVEASQQVVAGLNIQLTMLFQDVKGNCVGACTVLVYNHFGELSVTKWSKKELACQDVEALLEDEEKSTVGNDDNDDDDDDDDVGVGVGVGVNSGVVVLEDFSNPMHVWKEMNDPVMGGKSTGTFHIENGLGRFVGEVVDVPFLHAPGFIKGHTTDHNVFPDVTSCQALQIIAKSNTEYAGYRISFGRAHAPGGKFFAFGYKANLGNIVPPITTTIMTTGDDGDDDDDFGKITIPFSQFTDFWDDATGEPIHTCQEDTRFCPDEMTLKNLKVLEIWGEGVGGVVDLEILRIQAVGCNSDSI